jgi:hypothetical protein
MTIQEQIDNRVKESVPGTLFFVNDFSEFDNVYVSKILSLIASYGLLERLAKGIYYKPIVTDYGIVYPSAEKIVKAIADHEHSEILPTGEAALNALGFSTQVATKPAYLTTGTPRVVTIGQKQIHLKRRAPRMYAYHSKLMPILELALKAKGQNNITETDMNQIRALLLDSQERELIYTDLANAPVWIKKLLKHLFKEL